MVRPPRRRYNHRGDGNLPGSRHHAKVGQVPTERHVFDDAYDLGTCRDGRVIANARVRQFEPRNPTPLQ